VYSNVRMDDRLCLLVIFGATEQGRKELVAVLSWSITAIVFFLLTLYALSVALKAIDVGIGYAVWAGIGAVGSAVFGSVLFDNPSR
jgi:quaternary ammonium compound-resistance protein SugE